jgi:hypothetical protein
VQASSKQISEWILEIIKNYNLTKETNFKELTESIAKYFMDKVSRYDIYVQAFDDTELFFEIRKIKPKEAPCEDKEKIDDLDDLLFGEIFTPMTDEEREASAKLRVVFIELTNKLGILHPIHYPEIIKKIGLSVYDEPPKNSDENFQLWATKCIEYFKFTKSTPKLELIKNSAQFFDMIFTTYSIKYGTFKQAEKFPIYIDKLAERPLSWAVEIDIVRKNFYAYYIHILNKLQRTKDYPDDSEFWYSLVYLYDTMGLMVKTNEFGDIALKSNHYDSFELSQLCLYFVDRKRIKDGLRYLKKLGGIYLKEGKSKLALQIWNIASTVDQGSDVVSALLKLFDELGMKNELNQLLSYVTFHKDKYNDIKDLVEKLRKKGG